MSGLPFAVRAAVGNSDYLFLTDIDRNVCHSARTRQMDVDAIPVSIVGSGPEYAAVREVCAADYIVAECKIHIITADRNVIVSAQSSCRSRCVELLPFSENEVAVGIHACCSSAVKLHTLCGIPAVVADMDLLLLILQILKLRFTLADQFLNIRV